MIWTSTYAAGLRKLEVLRKGQCGQLLVAYSFIEVVMPPHIIPILLDYGTLSINQIRTSHINNNNFVLRITINSSVNEAACPNVTDVFL